MAGLNFLSSEEIEKIRAYTNLPSLEIVARPDWGAKQAHHRESIHGELKAKMAHAYPLSDSSISHCPSLGGFAFVSYPSNQIVQLGFDIEEDSRVTEATARRICLTEKEFLQAPSWASLWAAKEAAFKCLKGPQQPLVVSEIELGNWQKLDSQFETVSIKDLQKFGSSRIEGLVFKKNSLSLAFFTFRP